MKLEAAHDLRLDEYMRVIAEQVRHLRESNAGAEYGLDDAVREARMLQERAFALVMDHQALHDEDRFFHGAR